jgi:hypothetical protein
VPVLPVAERVAQLAALTAESAAEDAPAGVPVPEAGAPRCAGETAGGAPCTAFRLKGSLFCQWHDPDRRAAEEADRAERAREQDAARAARAAARREEAWAARLETPAQLRAFVAAVARAVWERRLGPEDAQACLEGARLLAGLLGAGSEAAAR